MKSKSVTSFDPYSRLTLQIGRAAFGYLLLAFILPLMVKAQYQFESWDTDRGLPHNLVQSILQTRDGYLWLATSDGLARFDGVRFTVFNIANTKGITSNRFGRFYEDKAGNLWITTEEPWLIKYRDGTFTSYSTGVDTRYDVPTAIWENAEGHLVISTRKGFARLQDEKFLTLTSPETTPCTEAFLSSAGVAWCHDDAGLHVLMRDGRTALYTLEHGLPSNNVSYVYLDRAGNLWIATRDAGMVKYKDGVFTRFLPEAQVDIVVETRDGALWCGTGGAGLVRFENNSFTTYTTADGLSDNTIKSLYEDREGTLWAGTLNHGLVHLNKQLITTLAEPQGLSPVNTYPMLEDHTGALWLGTWSDGLNRYENGRFNHFRIESAFGPLKWVTALAEDRAGRLWIGALRSSVGWFRDGKYTSLPEVPGDPTAISALLLDHHDVLWIGTNSGLEKYQDGVFTTYKTDDGLAGNDVKALHEDRQGNLWIGTYGGLTKMADGKFESYTKQDGLVSDRVRSLYEDQDGVLWIGTYDGGLSRLKDRKVVSYTVKDGLFDGGVFQILEDAHGNFWMSCNHGIYRVSKQELNDFADRRTRVIHSLSYGKRDGMLNVECNGGTQPAGLKARDGRLWFPTQEGVAIIDPEKMQPNLVPPPVVIESGLLDQGAIDVRQGVRIEPGQESLEIHYTALSFIKPEQIEFKYKLEGLDKDWVEAGSRRVAYYAHLPPGQYTFMVRAANADGVWNTAGERLLITVVPPFWRRWWFITLAICIVGAAVFLIYEGRISQLRRARAAQEAFSRQLIESQENERQRLAAELHDSLGQSLSIIVNRADLLLNKPQDQERTAAHAGEIAATASEAIREVRAIAYQLRPVELDRLGLTKALRAMAKKVSTATGIRIDAEIEEIDDLFGGEAQINLYRIVQESISNIVKHSAASQAKLIVKREPGGVALTVHDNGRGFSTAGAQPSGGFGLKGISERARILGGRHTMQSTPGHGTTVSVYIDLRQSPDGR